MNIWIDTKFWSISLHAVITKFVLHSSATIANLMAVEKLQFKEIEIIASKAKTLQLLSRPLIEGNISKYVVLYL